MQWRGGCLLNTTDGTTGSHTHWVLHHRADAEGDGTLREESDGKQTDHVSRDFPGECVSHASLPTPSTTSNQSGL